MTVGGLYRSPTHGLIRFDRWDETWGEVTAECTMLDYDNRKTWLGVLALITLDKLEQP